MKRYTKLLLASMTVALALAAAVGSASAGRIEISEQSFRLTWAPLKFTAGGLENECHVTLEGSFHTRIMNKVIASLIGYITAARVNRCNLVTTTALNLPWHIRYAGFSGRLPNITKIRINVIDLSFSIEGAARCLFQSTAMRPAAFEFIIGGAGVIGTIEPDATARIPLRTGVGCPTEMTLSRPGSVFVPGTTNAITVHLI